MRDLQMAGDDDGYVPLFEVKQSKGRVLYRVFAGTIFVAISLVWAYRVSHIPQNGEDGRWVWLGLLASELWFGFYWVLTQSLRWSQVYRTTFKDRLSKRYEKELPGVDIFVCTADPTIEPPILVVNTVLSVMAYDYPPEKLAVYLSDDGGSDLTFYALLEAASFAKHWVPYCKKVNVEPRSPAAYFLKLSDLNSDQDKELVAVKKLYEEMKDRIETATKLGRIPEEERLNHKGFSQWQSYSSKHDHGTILQILIDGKDPYSTDTDGSPLPTLVYLAREKSPQHFHNFKAGAMNSLIRVSSKISNGAIILNLDCDMYSNNSLAIRDALCFFMDEKKSHDIAFVQFPQLFENMTKNELYGSSLRVIANVEFHGLDGCGGPLYVGTGCFHRREILCGMEFKKDSKVEWNRNNDQKRQQTVQELEIEAKSLANCAYEQNTQWGNEMGLKYGCPVEDVITGLSIQCKGWKSAYFNPKEREAFLGLAPTTLPQTLLQHKRWSEGDFQILLSKYSPAWYAHGRISFGLQLGYCCYCLWAPNCLSVLYYSIIPSLYLLKGASLFPQVMQFFLLFSIHIICAWWLSVGGKIATTRVRISSPPEYLRFILLIQVSSPWFLPFAYLIIAKYSFSLVEFLLAGGTVLGWWNEQRIWLYKRTSSYLFAFNDTILKSLGFGESGFVITAKVSDDDVLQRYEKEIMEFGSSSPMFNVLSTLAILNLFCFVRVVVKEMIMNGRVFRVYEKLGLQIVLCGVLVLINLPLYQGLFFRNDKGKMPSSVAVKSFVFALLICTGFIFLY